MRRLLPRALTVSQGRPASIDGRPRRRAVAVVGVVVTALLPATRANAAPTIAFLNPSGYSSDPVTVSDVEDADGFVHLVAWASDVPSSALVEFELKPPGRNASSYSGQRVGDDTWEAFVPIPDDYADTSGYTLIARLYRGVPGNADEVANDEMTVEVDQSEVPPPQGETVELSYPDNGGRLGVFVPRGKRPVAVFDFEASPETNRVRAFYTLSEPGVAPVWEESCGSSSPGAAGFGKVRCTLQAGHGALDVSAVALVSNKTAPGSPPNAALDDTGDAHRVLPYLQEPSSVDVSQGNVSVAVAACHVMTALVTDQFDRAVAGLNLDVHADGPEDDLVFGTSGTETDPFQAPDVRHVGRESGVRCSDNAGAGEQGDHNSPQGDDVKHVESVDGTNDDGAFRFALRSDFAGGTFVQTWADVNDDDVAGLDEASGGTQIGWGTPAPTPRVEVFVSPSSVGAAVGFCVAMEVVARRSGGPFPNANVDVHLSGPAGSVGFCEIEGGSVRRPPESGGHVGDAHEDATRHGEGETGPSGRFDFGVTSPSAGTTDVQAWVDTADDDLPSGDPSTAATVTWHPPGERTISISSDRRSVRKGRRVVLSGSIEGDPACTRAETVNIQSRRVRGGRFDNVKVVTTDAQGSYTAKIMLRSSRRFRAVAPESGGCSRAQSTAITVRAR